MVLAWLARITSGAYLKVTYDWCDRVFRITGWVAVGALFDYLYLTTHNRSVWLISKVFDALLFWLVINIAFSFRLKRLENVVGARYGLYQVVKLIVALTIFLLLTRTMVDVAVQLTLARAPSAK